MAFNFLMCVVLPLEKNLIVDKFGTANVDEFLSKGFVLKQVQQMKTVRIPAPAVHIHCQSVFVFMRLLA